MSRLIVKNLPKSITEDQLRQIFGEKGLLTDVQLKYTTDGKFRQFAFLGFQDEKEAKEAINFFHNTFIQTSRIKVESCTLLGDKKIKNKHGNDGCYFDKKNEALESAQLIIDKEKEHPQEKQKPRKELTSKLLQQYKDDPKFEEFLQVHAPNQLHLLTANKTDETELQNAKTDIHESEPDTSSSGSEEEEKDETAKPAYQEMTDLEYMKTLMKTAKKRQRTEKKVKEKVNLFNVKLRGLPYSCRKKDIKQFFSPNAPFSIRLPRGIKGIAYVGFKTEKQFTRALLKDRSFIAGKRVTVIKVDSSEKTNVSDSKVDARQKKWKNQEESLKNEEDIGESGRIFVRNLAYTTTENDIQDLFSKYGPLTEVNLPIDQTTRKLKGFGTITFLMPEHAVKAYSELDGSILHGRMLHLLPGITKDSPDNNDNEITNYKQKKSRKEKAEAGLSHNWNSLFLGHNAVAEVIANTYGTSKKDVLDPHGKGSAAVRLALGETQIVATTRKYLEQEGVILDAFNTPVTKRSKTIILIKNLPADVQAKEIQNIFKAHGVLGRVILPPNAITAIVEYIESSEARKAFTKLAYSKFKNMPLYLEWAPENSLTSTNTNNTKENETSRTTTENNENIQESKDAQSQISVETKAENEVDEQEPEPDTTIFVKNLNFETTDEALYKHFEQCGKIHYATVATKKDKSDPGKKLSMGYGFVRFMFKDGVNKALKTLQQSQLDGKSLELKRSERTLRTEVTTARKTTGKTKQTGTKILVRNIPFQANKNEVLELFMTFGEIKALRIPKKVTVGEDSHRGFAFVDYFTGSDAEKAFEALSQSTHLYGRRLVLEWAATDDGVEQIRKRTADHFHQSEEVKSKKSIFNLEEI